MLIPIFFEGELSTAEIESIFKAAGYVVRTENGRLVARRMPPFAFIRKVADEGVVVPLRRGRGIAR